MKELLLTKIEDNLYYFEDEKRKEYRFLLSFFCDENLKPKEFDIFRVHESVANEGSFEIPAMITFGNLDDSCGRKNVNEPHEDYLEIIREK